MLLRSDQGHVSFDTHARRKVDEFPMVGVDVFHTDPSTN